MIKDRAKPVRKDNKDFIFNWLNEETPAKRGGKRQADLEKRLDALLSVLHKPNNDKAKTRGK